MKLKLFFLIVCLLSAGMAISGQIKVAKAASGSMATSPITAPFRVSGRVTYKVINRWTKTVKEIIPAKGAWVEISDTKFPQNVWIAPVDDNGYYVQNLNKGTYQIRAVDKQKTVFKPLSRKINVVSNIFGLDFQGTIYTSR